MGMAMSKRARVPGTILKLPVRLPGRDLPKIPKHTHTTLTAAALTRTAPPTRHPGAGGGVLASFCQKKKIRMSAALITFTINSITIRSLGQDYRSGGRA